MQEVLAGPGPERPLSVADRMRLIAQMAGLVLSLPYGDSSVLDRLMKKWNEFQG